MKIYIAASFAYADKKSTEAAQQIIMTVAYGLRNRGFDVFVPHEHKLPNAWDLSNHDWGMAVYGMDVNALEESDVVVALSQGKQFNQDGFALECGYACGRGKRVILLSLRPEMVESIMITSAAYTWLNDINELLNYDFDEMPQIRTATNEVS